MEKTQILSIGRDPVLIQKLSRFINVNAQWESTATIDDETAIQHFHLRNFDIVLLYKDLENESINKLSSVFSFQNPDILIIKDIGDSTQILEDKIKKALQTKKKPVNIVDDAFKDSKKD
ncbi:MAG: hypothetical protein ABI366_05305 [Ginsengibacter sp.]